MKEINRSRLTRAGGSRTRSHSPAFWSLALLLCLGAAVAGFGVLFESNLRVRAAQIESNAPEKLSAPRKNLLRSFSSDHRALAKFEPSEDHLWRDEPHRVSKRNAVEIAVAPASQRTLSLNEFAQKELLRHAPLEFTKAARLTRLLMTLPMPDGTLGRFRVEESPVMEPRLAAQFPEIKTYRGQGVDDLTATTRFDVTPAGFHAIVLSSQGTVVIEPARKSTTNSKGFARGRIGQYVSYNQRDAANDESAFSCVLLGAEQASAQTESKQLPRRGDANLATGPTLRTLRLALAATAEFTFTYGGGTVDGALSVMTTLINGVNAIYERDLAIHLNLVANESAIIFTNSATDGYTSNNPNSLLPQNQVVLDQRIGATNYDIGMVVDGRAYAEGGGFVFQGAANYQSVCLGGSKGKAATIYRSTDPTSIAGIWVASHELGHMLGALHTFNGTLNDCGPSRFAEAAYEPGSGSTIMGYRGGVLPDGSYFPVCSTEDLFSTDTYFHAKSIEQIVNYAASGTGSCAATSNTGNNPPSVDAGIDYTIPAQTPFALTAAASDTEADALSYCWEEYDLGAAGPPHTDNGNRPIFRSFAPVPGPMRTFPRLSDILSGTQTFGESLPTTTRTMNFRVTVRDNHAGAGGVNTGMMHVNVVSGSGPFAVTQPGSGTTWTGGSTQTVNWNVANTVNAPVSCANVRILLSIDGGLSFPYTLVGSTPNNGAATIVIPNASTSTARIKVEAVGNIFFSISLPNFTITPGSTAAPQLLTEANTNRAVALDSVTFVRDPFSLATTNNFSLDQRTRVILFAVGLDLVLGEDASAVTAQAEDAAHNVYPLTVEFLGKVPGQDWMTQMNVRLPNGLPAGDVSVSVSLRGATSNKAVIGIR